MIFADMGHNNIKNVLNPWLFLLIVFLLTSFLQKMVWVRISGCDTRKETTLIFYEDHVGSPVRKASPCGISAQTFSAHHWAPPRLECAPFPLLFSTTELL